MLIKLLPHNISSNWDIISYAISQSLPPTAGEGLDKMNRILEALLSGGLECWVQYVTDEEGVHIYSIGTTKLSMDQISNTRSLLIYSVYNYLPMTLELWEENYRTLLEYAKSKKCVRITGYTEVDRLKRLVNKFDGETKYTFISLPV